ncbi:MAG: TlpA family protein disulfide reductase [Candidatus Omnitrophica bacterium]|nr:TlpA family protein disulfide reductase [Candidatus Omnitrophota bacterium]
MFRLFIIPLLLITFLLFAEQEAGAQSPAKEWTVSEWINSDPLTLEGLRGKVVVLEFFQLWCPGCNHFSIPLMQRWENKYRNNKRVQLISIHAVFEGHDVQTPLRLRQFIKEKGIRHPVAIDRHSAGSPIPDTMRAYGTRGTPEMAIIDKAGHIRFQKFGSFDWFTAEHLIEELLRE